MKAGVNTLCFSAYVISVAFIMYSIKRVDDVVFERAELHNLTDFKKNIDDLNTHVFSSADQENQMLKDVQDHLNKPATLIGNFVRKLSRGEVPPAEYDSLAKAIEQLHPKNV